MNIVSNIITASIILNMIIQLWETTRPMKGKGLLLLFGDVHMLPAVPWLIYVFFQHGATWMEVILPIALGSLLAIPLILSTKFVPTRKDSVRFQRNAFLYLFLVGIPVLRRFVGFNWFLNQHPIYISHSHIPKIELMIVMYVTVIVVNIYVWRLVSYAKYLWVKLERSNASEAADHSNPQ